MEITIFNGKIHYKLPFSIAMLVYQRVGLMIVLLPGAMLPSEMLSVANGMMDRCRWHRTASQE
jgi:hypothetical protein